MGLFGDVFAGKFVHSFRNWPAEFVGVNRPVSTPDGVLHLRERPGDVLRIAKKCALPLLSKI